MSFSVLNCVDISSVINFLAHLKCMKVNEFLENDGILHPLTLYSGESININIQMCEKIQVKVIQYMLKHKHKLSIHTGKPLYV